MKVSEAMTRKVTLCSPNDSICNAAQAMTDCNSGLLPVGEGDRLIGMITDRDIAVRAVAKRLSPETPVRDVMSSEVLYCFEDQNVDAVAKNMADQQVRRLPVLSREKRLVGIVSLGDIARQAMPRMTGATLSAISKPGGAHDQSQH